MVYALSPALLRPALQPAASAGEALLGCIQRAVHPGLLGTDHNPFATSVAQDVEQIVAQGRPAMLCALCDLHRLSQAAQVRLKSEKAQHRPAKLLACRKPAVEAAHTATGIPASTAPAAEGKRAADSPSRKGMHPEDAFQMQDQQMAASTVNRKAGAKHAERKIWFFMCWVNEQGPAMAALLCKSLSVVIPQLLIHNNLSEQHMPHSLVNISRNCSCVSPKFRISIPILRT